MIILGHFFRLIFQVVFQRSLFRIFNDFCVPRGSQIGAFLILFEHFLVIRCIWENCALAAVSARFSRFQGLSNHTFSMFFQVMFFKCIFKTFICFFCDFSDFGGSSGASLAPFWEAKEPKKGTLFLQGSQEGPWEGLGSNFKWIWEVFGM